MPCEAEAQDWSEDSKRGQCAEPGLYSEALEILR